MLLNFGISSGSNPEVWISHQCFGFASKLKWEKDQQLIRATTFVMLLQIEIMEQDVCFCAANIYKVCKISALNPKPSPKLDSQKHPSFSTKDHKNFLEIQFAV